MYNVGMIKFNVFSAGEGTLSAIEGKRDIPFDIKRVYYITGVPEGAHRGSHAHHKLHQVLICLNGSVTIKVHNAKNTQDFALSSPSEGLYIGPHVWREMYDFSPGCVLLVLASELYDELDYIRSYPQYLDNIRELFS